MHTLVSYCNNNNIENDDGRLLNITVILIITMFPMYHHVHAFFFAHARLRHTFHISIIYHHPS